MAENNKARYCTECGAFISTTENFCRRCGAKAPVDNVLEHETPTESAKISETTVHTIKYKAKNKDRITSLVIFLLSLLLASCLAFSTFAHSYAVYLNNYTATIEFDALTLLKTLIYSVIYKSNYFISKTPEYIQNAQIQNNFYFNNSEAVIQTFVTNGLYLNLMSLPAYLRPELAILAVVFTLFAICAIILVISSFVAIIVSFARGNKIKPNAKDYLRLPQKIVTLLLCLTPVFAISLINFSNWGKGSSLSTFSTIGYGYDEGIIEVFLITLISSIILGVRAKNRKINQSNDEHSIKKPFITLILALVVLICINLPTFTISFADINETYVKVFTVNYTNFDFTSSFSNVYKSYYDIPTYEGLSNLSNLALSLFNGVEFNENYNLLNLLFFSIGRVDFSSNYILFNVLTYLISYFVGMVIYFSLQEIFYGNKYYNKSAFSKIVLFILIILQTILLISTITNVTQIIEANDLARVMKVEISLYSVINLISIISMLTVYKNSASCYKLKSSYDNADVSYAPYVVKIKE